MAASHALYQLSYGPGTAKSTRSPTSSHPSAVRLWPHGRCGIPRPFLPSTNAADAGAGVQPPTLESTIHGVFRFDDAGRIALLYLTPYDADALDAYLP